MGICSAQASVKTLADEVQLSDADDTVELTQQHIANGNFVGISMGIRDTKALHYFQPSRADLMPGSEGQVPYMCIHTSLRAYHALYLHTLAPSEVYKFKSTDSFRHSVS